MAGLERESKLPSSSWWSWLKDPILIIALAVVFSLDQITKAVVRYTLSPFESFPREGSFRIIHTTNTGSAFGLFSDQTLFLIIASFLAIGVLLLIYRHQTFPSLPLRLSLGMQLGGALGNLIDRIRLGEVTDFVGLSFWPVFNVADASIVIGIFIVVSLFLFGRLDRNPANTASNVPGNVPSNTPSNASDNTLGNGDGSDHDDGSSRYPEFPAVGDRDYGEMPEGNDPTGRAGSPPVNQCPVCDSPMEAGTNGWRCPRCGDVRSD